ncbi:ABC transporter permease [Desulfosporosinus sp. PR]|uniref:ABC transporter permease n=1 Tax=Candidatus Desulfosporosinus nitrosoreducens TaxID=3401928 RepID=UPI0027E888F7|nr:ABC transporter permease [Desulfosporosinus sp. PR]MDQ7096017.1 ABC transporter permease [Desulfosporosinus sp. PR]
MLWAALMRPDLWAATLAMATPIALPALGGTFSERSGVVNIAMEGIMLIGAFFGVLFAHYTNSAWIGLVGALMMGALISVLFAYVTVNLGADQVIVGMGINIFAAGLTAFLLNTIFGYGGTPRDTPALPNLTLPGINRIPILGPVFGAQNVVVYLMLVLVLISHYFLFHTNLGLRLRAVGENPQAADTAGLNVRNLRYLGVIIGGMLSSLGGVYLSLGLLNSFEVNMSGGRGYIALAAMIFGKWTPLGSLGAALLFGFAMALSMILQGGGISANIIQMLPYALTILALTGLVGRSTAPAADGIPYNPNK